MIFWRDSIPNLTMLSIFALVLACGSGFQASLAMREADPEDEVLRQRSKREIQMPKAVVDFSATTKFDLKSCSGAYVELRRMSYGEKMSRTQMAMEMAVRDGKGKSDDLIMQMTQSKVIEFEFRNCIIDHNLEDENGQRLDFKNPANVHRLHPAIGDEVSALIESMNTFEETEEAKN